MRTKILKPLQKQGRLIVGTRRELGIHNHTVWMPVYKVLPVKTAKKKKKR